MTAQASSPHAGNRRWLLWWPLLGVCAWLAFFADPSPATDEAVSMPTRAAAPAAAGAPIPAQRPRDAAAPPYPSVLALVPREQLIPAAPAASSTRDPFSARSWTPPPPPVAAAEPAAPVAPPMPYSYVGKKLDGDTWEVYLARGEQTFIVRAGQLIEGSWRAEKVEPPQLTLTYLPLGQTQTLSIGDAR